MSVRRIAVFAALGASLIAGILPPSPIVLAEEEQGGEPGGSGCGQLWDFTKGEQKSHSSNTTRFGWDAVDEHYNINHSHSAWGGKHTLDIAAHTPCD